MSRCQVLIRGERCTLPSLDGEYAGVCRWHRGALKAGERLRLTGNRQARIAHDMLGHNPQVRVAPIDTRETRQEIEAA